MSKRIAVIFVKVFFLSCWIISPSANATVQPNSMTEASCHPTPNPALAQFIIGYGSLIQSASKNKTCLNTGNNVPILLSGFKRGWFSKGSPIGFSTIFLGVIEDKKSKINGVIFSAPSTKAIAQYDAREKFYCRTLVTANSVNMLNHAPVPTGQIWIYVSTPDSIAKPSNQYPIVQSYVDIFLSGCLEIQKKYQLQNFASDCIDTTSGWSSHWINDRIFPRRAFANQPDALKIDTLLAEKMPDIFRSIKLEQTE